MELLILDTSKYADPLSDVWHANPRYTAAFLRGRGVDTSVQFVPVLDSHPEPFEDNPLALYFEVSDDNISPSVEFLSNWRRIIPDTHFFIRGTTGGHVAEAMLNRYPEIAGVVVGEAEETLAEVVSRLKSGQSLANIAGLRVRDVNFRPRSLLANLDELGIMIMDDLGTHFARAPAERRIAYLLAGRGCYANCSFCSVPSFIRLSAGGKRWRMRDVRVVVDEMEAIATDFGVRRFAFQDENFFGPGKAGQGHARKLAAEILRRRLGVQYFISCRVNDVDAETLVLMKESGLTRIGIGVESLNQSALSLFQKGYGADAVYPALEVVNSLGIVCEVNLIFFEPLMSLSDVRRNLDFIDFIVECEWLTYSDSFPFRTLFVAPWSPVAIRLAKRDALEHDGMTCRFRDPRVAALAGFAKRLQTSLPAMFKQQSIVASSDGLHPSEDRAAAVREASECTARLREWVSLEVLPRFMRAALTVVEQRPGTYMPPLEDLEVEFSREMSVLRRLGGRLLEIVAT
jgi:hypothetical protein